MPLPGSSVSVARRWILHPWGTCMAKVDIRQISRETPAREEVSALIDTFIADGVSPIVTGILGLALLEYELERQLRPRFKRRTDTDWMRLIGEGGPLSTFSQKVIAAYSFGLIDDDMKHNLTALAAIRNVFAHSKKLITFDHPSIKQKLRTIRPPLKKNGLRKSIMAAISPVNHRQGAYTLLCLVISTELTTRHMKKRTAAVKAKIRRLGPIARRIWDMSPEQQAFASAALGPFQIADPKSPVSPPSYAEQIVGLAALPQKKTAPADLGLIYGMRAPKGGK
jgi:hypothetical protein